jgi:acyl carrier protein
MTRDEAYVLVSDILRDVLGRDDVPERDGLQPGSLPGWDSLAQVAILAAAEVRCGIRISAAEAERILCLGDLVELVLDKSRPSLAWARA